MVADLLGQRVSLAGDSLLLLGRLVARIGIVGWVGSSRENVTDPLPIDRESAGNSIINSQPSSLD